MRANRCRVARKRLKRFSDEREELSFRGLLSWRIHHFSSSFDSMKTSCAIIALLALTVAKTQGQSMSSDALTAVNQGTVSGRDTPWSVTAREANQRTWQQTPYETTPDGWQIPRLHKITELATGLHFWENGQWTESKEEIEVLPDGTAKAVQGQHKAYFPADIYQGVIRLVTPDGKLLESRPLGISYDDGTQTVLIAELKSSIGQLVASNQIIYPDAFTDFKADLRYTYTKASFEQDIILREQPMTADSYGLNPATARLQVLTEFFNTPEPTQHVVTVRSANVLSDTALAFGQMALTRGKAFSIGAQEQSPALGKTISVVKSWQHLSGRTFLVEELPVQKIETQLEQLPAASVLKTSANSASSVRHKVSAMRLLPPMRLVHTSTNSVQLVRMDRLPKPGVVVDYIMLDSSSDLTLQGDKTYEVSGPVNVSGTLTIEGGTVVKYTTNNTAAIYIMTETAVNCKTDRYRPAIFTSVDDNSVGESLGSGTPSGYYGNVGLCLSSPSWPIHNLRFSHLNQAVGNGEGVQYTMADIQIVGCQYAFGGVENSAMTVNNGLISNARSMIGPLVYSWQFEGNHLTIHHCETLIDDLAWDEGNSDDNIYLTNCLLVAVTNLANDDSVQFFTNSVFTIADDSGVFQTVGGGRHYLATNSIYRNYGTINISPSLLAQLRQKTTWPPIIYSNGISTFTNFSPQVARDTDSLPAVGYHYDPIDYIFEAVCITNATLTVNPGTVIAAVGVGTDDNYWGLRLNGGQFICQGLADSLNHIVAYNTVQEWQPNASWAVPGGNYAFLTDSDDTAFSGTAIKCRFTDWSMLAQDSYFVLFNNNQPNFSAQFQNCQFHDGHFYTTQPISLTNCLLERIDSNLESTESTDPSIIRNNLILGGTFRLSIDNSNNLTVTDNLFDRVDLWNGGGFVGGCNAYITNHVRLYPFRSTDVILTNSPAYQCGPLGDFYLPADSLLINAGSAPASSVGLYHFTTQTNQEAEGCTTVDIGYHYLATQYYIPANSGDVIRGGFNNQQSLAAEDDNSSDLIDLPMTINFYGTTYSNLYINQNGNITFDVQFDFNNYNPSCYRPTNLASIGLNIIAPFWADVDPRNTCLCDSVYYGTNAVNGRMAFGANWVNVGYYSLGVDKLDSFQLVLIDRSDVATGDFDMEFNYARVEWEAGSASGGDGYGFWNPSSGINGPPRAGWASISDPTYTFELNGSGMGRGLLDTNLTTGLIHTNFNSPMLGRYVFQFRNGNPAGHP
jgi:hypothetical protein